MSQYHWYLGFGAARLSLAGHGLPHRQRQKRVPLRCAPPRPGSRPHDPFLSRQFDKKMKTNPERRDRTQSSANQGKARPHPDPLPQGEGETLAALGEHDAPESWCGFWIVYVRPHAGPLLPAFAVSCGSASQEREKAANAIQALEFSGSVRNLSLSPGERVGVRASFHLCSLNPWFAEDCVRSRLFKF